MIAHIKQHWITAVNCMHYTTRFTSCIPSIHAVQNTIYKLLGAILGNFSLQLMTNTQKLHEEKPMAPGFLCLEHFLHLRKLSLLDWPHFYVTAIATLLHQGDLTIWCSASSRLVITLQGLGFWNEILVISTPPPPPPHTHTLLPPVVHRLMSNLCISGNIRTNTRNFNF